MRMSNGYCNFQIWKGKRTAQKGLCKYSLWETALHPGTKLNTITWGQNHNCTWTNQDSLHRCGHPLPSLENWGVKQLPYVLANRHVDVNTKISRNYNTHRDISAWLLLAASLPEKVRIRDSYLRFCLFFASPFASWLCCLVAVSDFPKNITRYSFQGFR